MPPCPKGNRRRAISASTAQRIAARRIATADYATALVPEIRPQANCPDGWGTTKVGDPSGKDEARQLITEETIATNKAGIKASSKNF